MSAPSLKNVLEVSQATGRKDGDFIHTIGDAHVYLNRVDALQEQLKRDTRAFPKIKINLDKKNMNQFLLLLFFPPCCLAVIV